MNNLWSTFLELDALYEDKTFDNKNRLTEWKLASSNQPAQQQNTQVASQTSTQSANAIKPAITSPNGKCVVVIVSDKGRLRAMGTDGVNPAAFVAFPNDLRQFEGQKYEVDQLIWNGKNYRVSGNIVEI